MSIIFCPNCKEEIFFHNGGCEYCGWVNFGVSLDELETKQSKKKESSKEKESSEQKNINSGKVASQRTEI